MKSLLCCYILSIAYAITGNTQPYISAHRTIEQFQIYDNSFKTIIRDFIAYEQEYCTEYSINWYISISIKQLSGHRFNIKVTPIPLEGKSAIYTYIYSITIRLRIFIITGTIFFCWEITKRQNW